RQTSSSSRGFECPGPARAVRPTAYGGAAGEERDCRIRPGTGGHPRPHLSGTTKPPGRTRGLRGGGSDRRRSGDLSIFSRTLYQLSYRAVVAESDRGQG